MLKNNYAPVRGFLKPSWLGEAERFHAKEKKGKEYTYHFLNIYDSPNSPTPTKKTRVSSSDEHCLLGFVPFNFIQFCLAQGAAGGLTVAVANARLALKKVAEFQVSSCDEEMGVPTGGQRCPTNIIESCKLQEL